MHPFPLYIHVVLVNVESEVRTHNAINYVLYYPLKIIQPRRVWLETGPRIAAKDVTYLRFFWLCKCYGVVKNLWEAMLRLIGQLCGVLCVP